MFFEIEMSSGAKNTKIYFGSHYKGHFASHIYISINIKFKPELSHNTRQTSRVKFLKQKKTQNETKSLLIRVKL
jgi:hypothetical protein